MAIRSCVRQHSQLNNGRVPRLILSRRVITVLLLYRLIIEIRLGQRQNQYISRLRGRQRVHSRFKRGLITGRVTRVRLGRLTRYVLLRGPVLRLALTALGVQRVPALTGVAFANRVIPMGRLRAEATPRFLLRGQNGFRQVWALVLRLLSFCAC